MLILHNNKTGNNALVAKFLSKHFKCPCFTVEENPCISKFKIILFIIPNKGDEELPDAMEEYICKIKERNKKYIICELGNYFGLENYCGCKKVAFKLLDKLEWEKISDISIDSLPNLNFSQVEEWVHSLEFIR